MKPLTLSIVLCTYQGETFLEEQLQSLLTQTRLPDEIVVGDDASTDGSWRILQSFADLAQARGISVRLTRHASNIGFVENFSATLRQATGEIVFLCDQDDIWHADKLAAMESRLAVDPDLLLLCSDARLIDAAGKPIGSTLFDALELSSAERAAVHDGRAFEEVLLRRTMVTGATAALRRELVDHALPVGKGWIHDEWLAIIAATFGRMDFLEQTLIDYRLHGANQVGVPMKKRTWVDKWRGLIRPPGEALGVTVERLSAVEARLNELQSPDLGERLRPLRVKRDHFVRRIEIASLPHMRRIMPIWSESRADNYRLFGTGWRSMLRDLLRRN